MKKVLSYTIRILVSLVFFSQQTLALADNAHNTRGTEHLAPLSVFDKDFSGILAEAESIADSVTVNRAEMVKKMSALMTLGLLLSDVIGLYGDSISAGLSDTTVDILKSRVEGITELEDMLKAARIQKKEGVGSYFLLSDLYGKEGGAAEVKVSIYPKGCPAPLHFPGQKLITTDRYGTRVYIGPASTSRETAQDRILQKELFEISLPEAFEVIGPPAFTDVTLERGGIVTGDLPFSRGTSEPFAELISMGRHFLSEARHFLDSHRTAFAFALLAAGLSIDAFTGSLFGVLILANAIFGEEESPDEAGGEEFSGDESSYEDQVKVIMDLMRRTTVELEEIYAKYTSGSNELGEAIRSLKETEKSKIKKRRVELGEQLNFLLKTFGNEINGVLRGFSERIQPVLEDPACREEVLNFLDFIIEFAERPGCREYIGLEDNARILENAMACYVDVFQGLGADEELRRFLKEKIKPQTAKAREIALGGMKLVKKLPLSVQDEGCLASRTIARIDLFMGEVYLRLGDHDEAGKFVASAIKRNDMFVNFIKNHREAYSGVQNPFYNRAYGVLLNIARASRNWQDVEKYLEKYVESSRLHCAEVPETPIYEKHAGILAYAIHLYVNSENCYKDTHRKVGVLLEEMKEIVKKNNTPRCLLAYLQCVTTVVLVRGNVGYTADILEAFMDALEKISTKYPHGFVTLDDHMHTAAANAILSLAVEGRTEKAREMAARCLALMSRMGLPLSLDELKKVQDERYFDTIVAGVLFAVQGEHERARLFLDLSKEAISSGAVDMTDSRGPAVIWSMEMVEIAMPFLSDEHRGGIVDDRMIQTIFNLDGWEFFPERFGHVLTCHHPKVREHLLSGLRRVIRDGSENLDEAVKRNIIRFLIYLKDDEIAHMLLEEFFALAASGAEVSPGQAEQKRIAELLGDLLECDLSGVSRVIDGIDLLIASAQTVPVTRPGKNAKRPAKTSGVTDFEKMLSRMKKAFSAKITSRDRAGRAGQYLLDGRFDEASREASLGLEMAMGRDDTDEDVVNACEACVTVCDLWSECTRLYRKDDFSGALRVLKEFEELMMYFEAGIDEGDNEIGTEGWKIPVQIMGSRIEHLLLSDELFRERDTMGSGDINAVREGLISDIGKALDLLSEIGDDADKVVNTYRVKLTGVQKLLESFDLGAEGSKALEKQRKKAVSIRKSFPNDPRVNEITGFLTRTVREKAEIMDDMTRRALDILRGARGRNFHEKLEELRRVMSEEMSTYAGRLPVLHTLLKDAERLLKEGQYVRAADMALLGMEFSLGDAGTGQGLYTGLEFVFTRARALTVVKRLKTDYDILNAQVETDMFSGEMKKEAARRALPAGASNAKEADRVRPEYCFGAITLEKDRGRDPENIVKLSGLDKLRFWPDKSESKVEPGKRAGLTKDSFKKGEVYSIVSDMKDAGIRVFLRVVDIEDEGETVIFQPEGAHGRLNEAMDSLPKKDVSIKKVSDPSMVERRNLLDRLIWTLGLNLDTAEQGSRTISCGDGLLDHVLGLREIPGEADISGIEVGFFNKDLEADDAQAGAVRAARHSGLPLVFIHGPPGTGKTSVIEEIVRQCVLRGEKVLVVSQSHAGVDNIGVRLKNSGVTFARVGNSPPTREEIQENWENREVYLERMRNRASVVLGTNNGFYLDRTLTFKKDPRNGRKIYDHYYAGNYDLVIIEEAGRATLSETIGPVSMVRQGGKVIMVGDHNQLPPYGISMEEVREIRRLLTKSGAKPRELDKIFSYQNMQEYRRSLFEMHHSPGWRTFMRSNGENCRHLLKVNRRSHWAIVDLVSRLFYGGKIGTDERNRPGVRPIEKDTLLVVDYTADPGSRIKTHESFSEETRSYHNITEVNIVLRKLEDALNLKMPVEGEEEQYRFEAGDMTVISPYKGQIEMIKLGIKVKAVLKDILSPPDEQEAASLFSDRRKAVLMRALSEDFKREGLRLIDDMEAAFRSGDAAVLRIRASSFVEKLLFSIDTNELVSRRNIRWTESDDVGLVDVETVDSIQGGENEIVILSLVRSNTRGNIGFMGTYDGIQRLDVAFSRARKKLWVIGDFSGTLCKASYNPNAGMAGFKGKMPSGRGEIADPGRDRDSITSRIDLHIANERRESTKRAAEIFDQVRLYGRELSRRIERGEVAVGLDEDAPGTDAKAGDGSGISRKALELQKSLVRELVRRLYVMADRKRDSEDEIVVALDTSWVPETQRSQASREISALRAFLGKEGLRGRITLLAGHDPNVLEEELAGLVTDPAHQVKLSDVIIITTRGDGKKRPFADILDGQEPGDSPFMAYVDLNIPPGAGMADMDFTDISMMWILNYVLDHAYGQSGKEGREVSVPINADPLNINDLTARRDFRVYVLTHV
ncbi:MAG: AAA domain-containing protein [Candidatus Omnitrophota bacterium]